MTAIELQKVAAVHDQQMATMVDWYDRNPHVHGEFLEVARDPKAMEKRNNAEKVIIQLAGLMLTELKLRSAARKVEEQT